MGERLKHIDAFFKREFSRADAVGLFLSGLFLGAVAARIPWQATALAITTFIFFVVLPASFRASLTKESE